MSFFDLNDFERQGQIENDVVFDDLSSAKTLLTDMISDALHSIQIYTPDLEPALYDNAQLMENILAMARGNRHARIQILVQDTSKAKRRGHALLRLAQALTSAIDIRVPAEEYRESGISFIIVDNKAFIYRPDIMQYTGIYNPNCKVRSQKLSEIFSQSWEHAEIDIETRRLSI